MFPTQDLAGFGIYLRDKDEPWVMRGGKVMRVWRISENRVRILDETEPDELTKLGLDWETDGELEDNIPDHPVFKEFLQECKDLYGW